MIDFLAGKVGVVFTALVLMGVLLATSGSFTREAQRSELEAVVDGVAGALTEVDGLRGEARLVLELPRIKFPYELVISGTFENIQTIRISAIGREHVERWLLLTNEVNDGEFEFRLTSPASIAILKREAITLELGGWG